MPNSVKELHNRHKDKQTRPSRNELYTALQSVTAIYIRAFIIVDALDKCTAADGCRATLLSEIFNIQAKSGINIFATSRINDEIAKLFDATPCLKIHASDEDVKTYLNGQMLRLSDIFDSGIRDTTATEIIKVADGM
jgi:hypothetical protein